MEEKGNDVKESPDILIGGNLNKRGRRTRKGTMGESERRDGKEEKDGRKKLRSECSATHLGL